MKMRWKNQEPMIKIIKLKLCKSHDLLSRSAIARPNEMWGWRKSKKKKKIQDQFLKHLNFDLALQFDSRSSECFDFFYFHNREERKNRIQLREASFSNKQIICLSRIQAIRDCLFC